MIFKRKLKTEDRHISSFRLYRDLLKRIFDILFSLLSLIILGIPMLIIAFLIKKNSPNEPVLFKQERIGKDNVPFTIYKFRTMVDEAPHQLATENFEHPERYTTHLGSVLRRTSLDELPQLFNVLKGQMSIIGPRPLIPNEHTVLQMRTELGANRVLPGITGLAQVNGRDNLIGIKKAEIDASYARNVNILIDLVILIRTVFDVINGRGINEGDNKD